MLRRAAANFRPKAEKKKDYTLVSANKFEGRMAALPGECVPKSSIAEHAYKL